MSADESTIRDLLRSDVRVAVFTGAGISADSGVPTFRGAASDTLWSQFNPMQLASMEGFVENPRRCYEWYTMRRAQLQTIQPNPGHHAIARLQERGAVVITQNIDGLHEKVAPPGAVIHRVHGSILEDKCSQDECGYTEAIDLAELPELRPCPWCGSYLRPAVVWFGEMLPPDVWSAAERAVDQCDVLLVVGTSGEVWPAAGLVHSAARQKKTVILVNLEPGSLDDIATHVFQGRAAHVMPRLV